MVRLENFLRDHTIGDVLKERPVICLQTEGAYPLLFSRLFVVLIAQKLSMKLVSKAMHNEYSAGAKASLQSTFLGEALLYWLHSDGELAKEAYNDWHSFLRDYQGPHTLIFCSLKPIAYYPPSWRVIHVPAMVDEQGFACIADMMAWKYGRFSEVLFKQVKSFPIDTAFLLCHYGQLIGKNSTEFIEQWLPMLVVPERSLFSLSQALFERKAHSFFNQWKHLALLYASPFWIAFWSEQLWRASCYVHLCRLGKYSQAKAIGYRLPFLFLKATWRLYSSDELRKAHEFLYDIDYHIKNGGSEHNLELFYARFLTKSVGKGTLVQSGGDLIYLK